MLIFVFYFNSYKKKNTTFDRQLFLFNGNKFFKV